MDRNGLNRAAIIKAGTIRNKVTTRAKGKNPRLKDYPAAVVSCSIIGSSNHKEDYSRPCQNYSYKEPILGALSKVGQIGAKSSFCHNYIGNCAEPHAANLLLKGLRKTPSIVDFVFGDTIRPRTMQVLPYCKNCKKTFPSLK